MYSELSYAELKTILENWLNPSATATGDDEIVDELEAPKAPAKPAAQKASLSKEIEDGYVSDLPWDKEESKPKAKDDVASAFDDLFNS